MKMTKGKRLAQYLVAEWHKAPPGSTFGSWVIDFIKGVDDKTLEDAMNGR